MSALTFTLIQAHLHWENKEANRQLFAQKINTLGQTHIVVLPEMFSTGFSMKPEHLAEKMDGPTVQWMRQTAAGKKIVLTGSLIIEEGGNYFNRLIWMLPNGQYGCYDKRHLFAYAEEDQHYTPGRERFIVSVNGWKINLMVCYDLRFPVWSRQAPLLPEADESWEHSPERRLEYDVLIYVANWPERRSHAWRTLLQARAIENQCYVVGVNRVGNDGNNVYHSGDSMVVDPLGEVLYHKAHEEDVFTITLEKDKLETIRERFPFWKDRDRFQLFT